MCMTISSAHVCPDPLREVAAKHPGVLIGSYPSTSDDIPYRVKLQLECRDEAALEAARQSVEAVLPTFQNPEGPDR